MHLQKCLNFWVHFTSGGVFYLSLIFLTPKNGLFLFFRKKTLTRLYQNDIIYTKRYEHFNIIAEL